MALGLLLVGLVTGIELRVAHPFVALMAGIAMLVPRRAPVVVAAGIVIAGIGLGSLTASLRSPGGTAAETLAAEVARCEVSGTLREHLGDNATLGGVALARCAGREPIANLGALAFPRLDAEPGTGFRAEGWILPLGDDGFEGYLARSGAEARFDPTEVSFGAIESPPLAAAARIKRGLRDAVSSVDPRAGALLLGLTIGDTSRIDPLTEEHLRRAGLTHLVAVSGHTVAYTDGFPGLVRASIGVCVPFGLPEPDALPFKGPTGLWSSTAGEA